MKTGRRTLTATAVAVVCAITVLAAPGTAFAAPTPRPSPGTTASAGTHPGEDSGAAPSRDLEAVRKKLERLYRAVAVATEEYNAAEERTKQQSAEIVELTGKIVRGREKLDDLEDRAGAAAASQYRGGGLPPEAHLMLSDDPQDFLVGAGRIRQGQHAAKGLLGEMRRTQEDLEQYAEDAEARWRKLETGRRARAKAQRKIEKRIAAAEKVESELEQEEKERLAELEREAAERAQAAWLESGVLEGVAAGATAQGRKAVAYATAQIGKPYVWGAEGPEAYDCSGLTSQAWAAAGRTVPRTSQEQWRRLPRVAVRDMRPGDLIIYWNDASHVGMYLGDGAMVHAPRPGRTVTTAGAGSMPILGVVRPGGTADGGGSEKEGGRGNGKKGGNANP
ncbi:C40 family peptidase [Streptomyces prasinopilosus]|uniref:Cell wall-associated hydrolase, NlpC family n=1 Tax=Streptomyces prasinopilosus TaxID=67344 RepID=A0A1G6QC72_9ACTN|nr:C40 family peptidase [Streptomyces prasinopilosus]SDC90090.1 Cell wall-associated hydrolase, NlpC family [Streptomyces prasinopilosus]